MRVTPEQPWHPVYLLQPLYGVLTALVFEWCIALYDMELDAVRDGRKPWPPAPANSSRSRKSARQLAKDHVPWPLPAQLAGGGRAT